jgi:hypothetical protein
MPLQVAGTKVVMSMQLAVHCWSGSVPAAIGPQVPFVPEPFFAAEHAWQVPLQALSQQNPSAQKPLWHELPVVHGAPAGWKGMQVPPVQNAFDAHWASVVHEVKHALFAQI